MTKKEFHERLPIQPAIEYDDNNNEMAIVIALYEGHYHKVNVAPDWYVKSAMVARHTLITHTDAISRKVPIYFFVEDLVYDRWVPFLIEYGVSCDRIIKFSCKPPVYNDMTARISKQFYVLNCPELIRYNNLIIWDADLFFCRHPDHKQHYNLDALRGDNIGVWGYARKLLKYDCLAHYFRKYGEGNVEFNYNEFLKRFASKAPSLLGGATIKMDEHTLFPHMGGAVIRYVNPCPIDFREFVLALEPLVFDEELIIALWSLYKPSADIDKIDLPPCAPNFEEALLHRGSGFYLLHLSNNPNHADDAKDLYYDDMGINK